MNAKCRLYFIIIITSVYCFGKQSKLDPIKGFNYQAHENDQINPEKDGFETQSVDPYKESFEENEQFFPVSVSKSHKKSKSKKSKHQKPKIKRKRATTPSVFVTAETIDEKYFYKDPIMNLYTDGRKNIVFKLNSKDTEAPVGPARLQRSWFDIFDDDTVTAKAANVEVIKCSNVPPSICVVSQSCSNKEKQPQGQHFCDELGTGFVCCTSNEAKKNTDEPFVKCSDEPPSICVVAQSCSNKEEQSQGKHFCDELGSGFVCCDEAKISTDKPCNKDIICSQKPLGYCILSADCAKAYRQPEGAAFCQKKNQDMVCCANTPENDPVYCKGKGTNNIGAFKQCSNKPPSVCVMPDRCSLNDRQPQGYNICQQQNKRMICCKDRVNRFLTRQDCLIKCHDKPSSICMMPGNCDKRDLQPRGDHFCREKNRHMVCCRDRGFRPSNESLWGKECLQNPMSICVLPKECSKKYQRPKGNSVCVGAEKMVCCNFFNFEYVWSMLVEGQKPMEEEEVTTPVPLAPKVQGEWGTRCDHKPKSICVLSRQCTEKYQSEKGQHLCVSKKKDNKMVCCDIYNYLWEMLFEHGNIEAGQSIRDSFLGKWGERCSDTTDGICVSRSECTNNFRWERGDHICGKLVCCQFYKQLWNLLIDNKLPDSDSDETTTTVKTTVVTGRSRSQWGEQCHKEPVSICVLPKQCTKKFRTFVADKKCQKGPEKMICCDFRHHIWTMFLDHDKLLNMERIKQFMAEKNKFHKRSTVASDIDEFIDKQQQIESNKEYEEKPDYDVDNEGKKSSRIEINGSFFDVHEVKIKKGKKKNNGRRSDVYRYIYLPNGELLWRMKVISKDGEDKNMTDIAFYSIQNALNKLLSESSESQAIPLPENLTKLLSLIKRKNSDNTETRITYYDNVGSSSEDTSSSDLSLGLSDTDSYSGSTNKYGRWGKSCSKRPHSICTKKKQCKNRYKQPQGNHFCVKKGLVCCEAYAVLEFIFADENSQVSNDIRSQWGKTCSKSPESICVLANQCKDSYKSPQGHHLCKKGASRLVCCDVYYIGQLTSAKTKNKGKSTSSKWGKPCSNERHGSICVSRNECVEMFEVPQGQALCGSKKNNICCDYSSLMYLVFVINGKYPPVISNSQDNWGIRCSTQSPSICVRIDQCSTMFHTPLGDHHCAYSKVKMVCCDFIMHIHYNAFYRNSNDLEQYVNHSFTNYDVRTNDGVVHEDLFES